MASYGAKPADRSRKKPQVPNKLEILHQLQSTLEGLQQTTHTSATGVPQKDLLVFFRQLSVILQSGVAIAQGMVLIAENMTTETCPCSPNNAGG